MDEIHTNIVIGITVVGSLFCFMLGLSRCYRTNNYTLKTSRSESDLAYLDAIAMNRV